MRRDLQCWQCISCTGEALAVLCSSSFFLHLVSLCSVAAAFSQIESGKFKCAASIGSGSSRRGRTSTPPLPPRRKRALPTWWQRRCNENTFNNSCTYRQYRSTTRCICPDERDPSYSGYSCSKPPRGTGGSREPPVPVKGVQAILAIAARLRHLGLGTWRPAIRDIAVRKHSVGRVARASRPSQ